MCGEGADEQAESAYVVDRAVGGVGVFFGGVLVTMVEDVAEGGNRPTRPFEKIRCWLGYGLDGDRITNLSSQRAERREWTASQCSWSKPHAQAHCVDVLEFYVVHIAEGFVC